jgi:membrane protein YdbS with pleckstrin-like domain
MEKRAGVIMIKTLKKTNYRWLTFGFFMFVVSLMEVLIRKIWLKQEWPSKDPDTIFLALGLIGLFWLIISIVNIIKEKGKNMDSEIHEYGIDYQKQLSTYKIIGIEKGKVKNGALKFQKYSEWKEYLGKEFANIVDNENAYHFMVSKLRGKEGLKELFTFLVVPVEIGIASLFLSIFEKLPIIKNVGMLVLYIFVFIFLTRKYKDCKAEYSFISDFIEIVFPGISNKEKHHERGSLTKI